MIYMSNKYIWFALSIILYVNCDISDNRVDECNLPNYLKIEIASYGPLVEQIIQEAVDGGSKGFTYNELATFVDKFGNRIAGSDNLENAIDYMLERSEDLLLENVHGEEVEAPHWVRGNESAAMLYPRYQKLAMLGLGSSIGTPPEGIIAEALVVGSFDELEEVADKVNGKIVIFNEGFVSYGQTVQYRDYAAVNAAKHGAVATLVRSVTPFSLNSPHTGWQDYSDNVTKIPTACITIEDANMLHRMQKRGQNITIELKMEAHTLPPKISRNTIAEIEGSQLKEKVVVVSGHLDSWDVGEGAMDDGGGAFISWSALVLLKKLNLRPKRTLRAILWTAEEEGLVGAVAYLKAHQNETNNFNFVMESDEGTFTPLGLDYAGSEVGACIVEEILSLLTSLNATGLKQSQSVGSDIIVFTSLGIPGASLWNRNEQYFWYHHSDADTMDVEDSATLDLNTALWATSAYIIADLSVDIPRKDSIN